MKILIEIIVKTIDESENKFQGHCSCLKSSSSNPWDGHYGWLISILHPPAYTVDKENASFAALPVSVCALAPSQPI